MKISPQMINLSVAVAIHDALTHSHIFGYVVLEVIYIIMHFVAITAFGHHTSFLVRGVCGNHLHFMLYIF